MQSSSIMMGGGAGMESRLGNRPPMFYHHQRAAQNEEQKHNRFLQLQSNQNHAIDHLIQEPTNQSDGILLTPYDLYSNEVPRVTSIHPNEPFMKISVVKSNNDATLIQNEFYVTPRGMVGSLRSQSDGDVMIGRQYITESGQRPNDILLPVTDLAISRTHCRIVYKFGFKSHYQSDSNKSLYTDKKSKFPPQWLEFFKALHRRKTARSQISIPFDVRRIIIEYLRDPQNFYVQDLGSVHGTFIKVSKDQSTMVKKGQNYQIGTDIFFNIVDVQYKGSLYIYVS